MLKSFLHLPRCLRRSRSPKLPHTDTGDVIGGPASSRSSSQLGASQHAQGDPVAAAQTISAANQLTHDSQPVISLLKSDSAQALGTHDPNQFQHDGLLVPIRPPTPPLHQHLNLPRPQDGNPGMLSVQTVRESRNVSVEGDMNQVYYYASAVVINSNMFMEKLLERTILGVAFDSSARDPPPRCHPGTRSAILARCLEFIANCIGEKKMRWVVGAAGVGKSAIMQSVAESPLPFVFTRVSIFFSINGRNDGTKTIITLAYQLAAKCEPYRQFIEHGITRDPSLLQSSVSVQFKKFVIEPFIHHPQINSTGRVLIIIDDLDECDKSHTQRELLQLISDFCLTYPTSPIVWLISSRPEPHITSFFAQDHVKAVYEKEEILVESDEARDDVEKFLRNELTRIQKEFLRNPQEKWPQEQDFWKLASASGGLFVYADTVIKYIGEPTYGNATSQLNDVLKVIDAHQLPDVPQEEHPMARLDALYTQILSNVPKRVMANTRKILLALVLDYRREQYFPKRNFLVFCNWLGMTCDDAYAAIRHLSSVLNSPGHDEAHAAGLRSFHKSFIDYIADFGRSGFSTEIELEAHEIAVQCSFRILEQAPDGIDFRNNDDSSIRGSGSLHVGALVPGPGIGSNISLTWPIGEKTFWDDHKTRSEMYELAISDVVEGIREGEAAFSTHLCIRLATSRWQSYNLEFYPLLELQSLVFEESRRHEFMQHGILKRVLANTLDSTYIVIWTIRLQFNRPTVTTRNPSDPWYPNCTHERSGDWGEGKDENWTTEFGVIDAQISDDLNTNYACPSCLKRLKQQLVDCKARSPDHAVTILFTSTGTCFVEFQFIDLDDGAEWTYWFLYELSEEERRILGSTV